MSQQQNITENMRAILVDWLVDVSVHFNVMSETLHYAVNYIDRTLADMQVEKTKLQLVGVACMKIADVFNEKSKEYYRQENSAEYSYITADEYSPQQVVAMEKAILNVLNFDLYAPTAVGFIKVYDRVLSVPPETQKVALFLSDLTLLSAKTSHFAPSLVASACLFLSLMATR